MSNEKPVTHAELLGTWRSEQGGEINFSSEARFNVKEFLIEAPEGDAHVAGAGEWSLAKTGSGDSKIALGFDAGATPTVFDGAGFVVYLYATKKDEQIDLFGILGDPDSGRHYLFQKKPQPGG